MYLYLQTFLANTDDATVVYSQLPAPITALCLRLHPLEWNSWSVLKMDVFGCLSANQTGARLSV